MHGRLHPAGSRSLGCGVFSRPESRNRRCMRLHSAPAGACCAPPQRWSHITQRTDARTACPHASSHPPFSPAHQLTAATRAQLLHEGSLGPDGFVEASERYIKGKGLMRTYLIKVGMEEGRRELAALLLLPLRSDASCACYLPLLGSLTYGCVASAGRARPYAAAELAAAPVILSAPHHRRGSGTFAPPRPSSPLRAAPSTPAAAPPRRPPSSSIPPRSTSRWRRSPPRGRSARGAAAWTWATWWGCAGGGTARWLG